MIKQLSILILSLLSNLVSYETFAQMRVSTTDFSFQYDINSNMRGRILSSKDDSTAIFRVNINAPFDSLKKYDISYSLVNSLEEDITSRIKLRNLSSYFQFED